MVTLQVSDERAALLQETVQAALEEAESVLFREVLDDRMTDTKEEKLALYQTQQDRVDGLRELLQDLGGRT